MFKAVGEARPAVHVLVDRINRHVFTPVIKYPPTGQGVARAKARLAAKLKANKEIPDTSRVTRQQTRADERRATKPMTPAEVDRRKMKAKKATKRAARGDISAERSGGSIWETTYD